MTTRFVLLCIILALSAGATLAQDGPNPIKFTIDVDHAVISHGDGDTWDNPYTDPGAVVYHDGQFHMFRNGFRAWPAKVDIGYLTSDDGLQWNEVSEDPIIVSEDAPFAIMGVLASSALVEDDGTWVLYFYTWPLTGGRVPGSVVRATAPAPTGPWTFDPDVLLAPGPTGSWDESQITAPSVVKIDDGYLMFYSATNRTSTWAIGMATSPDGITWQKYDNPDTFNTLWADSDPVFLPDPSGEAWDSQNVHQPRVRLTPDGLVMLYRAYQDIDQNRAFGLALSSDGITWERLYEKPIIRDLELLRRGMWFSELEYHDGTYYLFLELQRGYLNQTDIYAGTYTGPLR